MRLELESGRSIAHIAADLGMSAETPGARVRQTDANPLSAALDLARLVLRCAERHVIHAAGEVVR